MATITPTQDIPISGAQKIVWSALSSADTATSQLLGGTQPLAGAVQMESSSWGGATVVMQASNDGSNWATVKDVAGNDVSMTANGLVEFSSSALYIRPSSSGGTADSVNVLVTIRG